ncbi:MAG: biopolymer transporter ExbD [Fibrobacter sp.]|nr:biopolymer transporter ExbD [Fibrobacter sp.]
MAKSRFKSEEPPELDLLPIMNLFSILIPFLITIASFQKLGIVEVNLPERSDMVMGEDNPEPDEQALNLTVAITDSYLQIVARGGMLPKIFYKEMWTFRCKSDGDTITYDPYDLVDRGGSQIPKCRDGSETDKYEIDVIHLWTLERTSEEDAGTILTSLYSDTDSAYLDDNQEFVPNKQGIQVGSRLSTLAEGSRREIKPDVFNKMTVRPRSAYDELAKTLAQIHNRFIDAPDADNIIVLADDHAAFDKIIGVMDRARDAGFYKISLAKLGG